MGEKFKPIYRVGHGLSRLIMQTFFRAEAYNAHLVPQSGPFLLACNHASFLDPFLAASFIQRDIYFFARKSLFKPGFANWILHGFNSIPVDRDGGKDISALKRVLELLKQGQGVLVFPEGTRSKDGKLQPAKRGVGMMACRAQVPVVPTHIIGTFDVWGRNHKTPRLLLDRINVVYGKPLYPADFDPGKNDPNRYQTAADSIVHAISVLKPPKPGVI